MIKDPDEKVNLMNNPEYKKVFQKLLAVDKTFPSKDNDPSYDKIKLYGWEKKPNVKSQAHKIGSPGNPYNKKKGKEKKKKKKKKKK